MVQSFRNPGPTAAQLAPQVAAVLLSDSMPMEEGAAGAAGSLGKASRGDHAHKRLTATAPVTLDGTGHDTIRPFSRTFAKEPGITGLPIDDSAAPVPRLKVRRWLKADGSTWTEGSADPIAGCVVFGDRARALPALGGILLVGPLITALAGFLPYEPAAGARFSLIVVEASQ